ncbi:HAD-IA family hydrolase [Terribacillus aidingensis]|uniref:HAD-IA family hydrolase n=1 Tax=Terribacillus aidingensis TaxID=586416 RepID=UPI000BE3DBE0|nr:HAD-IA family hydrolase [Terribacillus aidingensis]
MNILWDFDGTLFDTYPAYTHAFLTVVGEHIPEKEIYQNLKVSFAHAVRYYAVSSDKEAEIKEIIKKLVPADLKPFDQVEEILKFADKNVIMTHKKRAQVLDILQHYGWEKYFVDMVAGDDGFPRKPDAASYKYLHNKHGVDLAIGDRELDLLPAKELGISTCMFQGQCKAADYQLENYADFFKLDFLVTKQ